MTALQFDGRVRELRYDAGPLAWFLLEELVLDAVRDRGELVVSTSVRSLAAAVSLNKDTVARALAVLAQLGAVEHRQPAIGGRFSAGRYVLTLPDGVVRHDDDTSAPRSRLPRTHAAAHVPPPEPAQLTLLDLAAADLSPVLPSSATKHPQPSDALAPVVAGRPAARSGDEDGTAGSRFRDEIGTARRTVRPC